MRERWWPIQFQYGGFPNDNQSDALNIPKQTKKEDKNRLKLRNQFILFPPLPSK